MKKLRVAIAGYGVVGKRRHFFINSHENLVVTALCEQNFKKNSPKINGINCYTNYKDLLDKEVLDVIFVCLTNNIAAEVTINSLKKGLHVFCEKPPGMNVQEIEEVIKVEKSFPELKLKYGFNHRYHYSVQKALDIIKSEKLGKIVNLRGVYGKSSIIPFSGGWRSNRKLAGGGILLDQGIHMLDLMRLFSGEFVEIKSFISNDFWNHDVEDNAYALMKDKEGRVAMLCSSATQWQHKFNLEISLSKGHIELHGILSGSKSYGEERITIGKKNKENNNGLMETKTIKFLQDNSWRDEVFEFASAIINDLPVESGNSNDALETMKLVFGIYYADDIWRNKYKIKV
jgi:predicted dehydrogenase